MNNRKFNQYVIRCMNVLSDTSYKNNIVDDKGRIPKEFNGYIATFGACIIQNGLLPAVAFFENKNANTQQDRSKLMKIILRILDKNAEEDSLLQYLNNRLANNKSMEKVLRREIINIAIALKQVIKTYELV